jgi:hypothetical protein
MAANGDNGHVYVTATEVRDEWPDVTPDLLRTWVEQGRLDVVSLGELADALGYVLPADVDRAAPAQAAGRRGAENVYRWADVSRVETATRLHRRKHGGRPRGRAPRRRPAHTAVTA